MDEVRAQQLNKTKMWVYVFLSISRPREALMFFKGSLRVFEGESGPLGDCSGH